MSALAIAWAISPPIVPAPTTAALNTNTARKLPHARGARRLELRAEARERLLERVRHRAADEHEIDQPHQRRALLELVGEAEVDRHPLVLGREADGLAAADRVVLDLDRLPHQRLVL